MKVDERLEKQIEDLRTEMYEAQEKFTHYEEVVKISQKLDVVLNKLDGIDKKMDS